MSKQKPWAALMSSASPEWYTPLWLYARIQAFLGADMLDPCARPTEMPVGLAGRENGLAATWRGHVYVNPPYGRTIGAWVRKALTEPLDEVVLLVPARVDTRWFQPLFDYPVCFIRGRLKFISPTGTNWPAPFPSALVYIGPRREAFAAAFADLGRITACESTRQRTLWEVTA